ncbi:MAG: hypothetical protein ACI9EF_001091 [Pseudohongiellaceae bacterium]|jgi:hypothetical protein
MSPEGRAMRSAMPQDGPNTFTMQMYGTLPDDSEWQTMGFGDTRSDR